MIRRRRLAVIAVFLAALGAAWLAGRATSTRSPQADAPARAEREIMDPISESDEEALASVVGQPDLGVDHELPDAGIAREVRIRVVDANGERIAGAEVIGLPAGEARRFSDDVLFREKTTADGVAVGSVRYQGPYVIAARASGFLPGELEIDDPGPLSVEVVLAKGKTLRARFVLPGGRPAANVPVFGVGIGHDLGAVKPEPIWRAYPGSGFARGVSDEAGVAELPGFGDEEVMIFLGSGWTLGWHRYPLPRSGVPWKAPVLVPGEDVTIEVWRKAHLLYRLVDSDSGRPIAPGIPIRIADPSFVLDDTRGQDRPKRFGSDTIRWDRGVYRGRGRYAVPVWAAEMKKSVPIELHFAGTAAAKGHAAACYGPADTEASHYPAIRVSGPERGLGGIRLFVPQDAVGHLPPTFHLSLKSVVNGESNWTRCGGSVVDPNCYHVIAPAGEYVRAVAFAGTLECNEPFAVAANREAIVHLSPVEWEILRVVVRVFDSDGRPLPNCGLRFSVHEGGTELRNWGGRTCGIDQDSWPHEIRERFKPGGIEELCAKPLYLMVLKPGFRTFSQRILLEPTEEKQVLEVELERVIPSVAAQR